MTVATRQTPAEGRRRLRILAGAPFVPWPATTYSNQVVGAKLEAMARDHEVLFVCGVATEEGRRGLEQLAAATGVSVKGVPTPSSRGNLARIGCHVSSRAQGAITGVPYTVYKSGNAPLRRTLAALAGSGGFDLLQIDYWYLARGWIHDCPIPSVCYVHDLMYERAAREEAMRRHSRWSGRPDARPKRSLRGLRASELRTLSAFDGLAAISPTEAQKLEALLPAIRVAGLPAGVDLARLKQQSGTEPEPLSVLFVGALTSKPNEDGAWAFARYAWPHVRAREPRARLYVVGSDPTPRLRALDGHAGVTIVGGVPDVRPWYRRCAIVVAPLRWGSGMKGKVLEAMALGRPLVASAVSMEGIAATPGQHYLAADTPPDYAAALHKLFVRPEERTRLAAAARRLVEDRYDMRKCMDDFLAFVDVVADA